MESEEKNEFVMQFKEIPEDEKLARAILYIGKKLDKQNKLQRAEFYGIRAFQAMMLFVMMGVLVLLFMLYFKL